jgi:hypothetical protein
MIPYSPAAAMLNKGVKCAARDSDGHDGLSVALRRRLPQLQVAWSGRVPLTHQLYLNMTQVADAVDETL